MDAIFPPPQFDTEENSNWVTVSWADGVSSDEMISTVIINSANRAVGTEKHRLLPAKPLSILNGRPC